MRYRLDNKVVRNIPADAKGFKKVFKKESVLLCIPKGDKLGYKSKEIVIRNVYQKGMRFYINHEGRKLQVVVRNDIFTAVKGYRVSDEF
jgi:hypothetical protein